jgi:hypothetical protein
MRTSLLILLAAALTAAACAAASGSKPPTPKPRLPYDMAVRGSALYVADGLRHQILRYDLTTRRGAVLAGTGRTGTSGDGGPARKARLTEPTELVVDDAGNLYVSDVNQGRVRRIDRAGIITTVARLPAVAGLSVDPTGRYLAMASIEGYVYRMELPNGPLQRLAGNGTQESTGNGGPAIDAAVNGPHDVTYDRDGNLLISGYGEVRRIDAATGIIDVGIARTGFKIVAVADGTFYLMAGDPSGGTITHVDAKGSVLETIGTGRIASHRRQTPLGRVAFLPSDVEPVAGAILISEARPSPSIRRLRNGGSTLTTLIP